MKIIFLRTIALSILFVACTKDDNQTTTPTDETSEEVATGTISMKTFVKNIIEVESRKAPILEEVLEDLSIYITQGIGIEILSAKYSDLPEFIELPSGTYDMLLASTGLTPFRFDIGRYGQDAISFTIVSGENKVVDITLGLMDVATTIDFSDEVLQNYPNIKSSAIIDYSDVGLISPLEWTSIDDERTGFFEILTKSFTQGNSFFEVATGDLIIDISTLDSAGNEILVTKTYPNISANQHYKITVSFSGASTASLNITLGEEEIIEDEITFPN